MDLLDFYRGALSIRRLGVLVRQLPPESMTVRALNGGRPAWGLTDHLIADLWALWAKKDHPVRAEAEEKRKAEEKSARVIKLNERRKRSMGLR